MNRMTIRLTHSRSYAKLAKAIGDMNKNIYGNEIFADDRIEFNPVYDSEYNLTHFEVTGSPLDMFQIGLRYGHMEERDHLSPYIKETYKDIFTPTPETIAQ
jgi:hypothetical protein